MNTYLSSKSIFPAIYSIGRLCVFCGYNETYKKIYNNLFDTAVQRKGKRKCFQRKAKVLMFTCTCTHKAGNLYQKMCINKYIYCVYGICVWIQGVAFSQHPSVCVYYLCVFMSMCVCWYASLPCVCECMSTHLNMWADDVENLYIYTSPIYIR